MTAGALTVLYWLTLGIVAAVVLALAGYLVAIAVTLLRARKDVSRLADALEDVAAATEPVGSRVDALAGAVPRIAEAFEGIDRELARCAGAFRPFPG